MALGRLPRTQEQLHQAYTRSARPQGRPRTNPAGTSSTSSSDTASNNASSRDLQQDSPDFNTRRDITRSSLTTTSHPLVTTTTDPEDQIFDSSSDSETSQNHNREEHQEPRWVGLHDQLRDLRRNIDDLRDLASTVIRTNPSADTRSQTSDLLDQIALLHRQLAGMEQQYSTQLQNFWSGQTAEAGATTDDNSNASNAIDNLQPSNNSQTNRTLNDEDLQRRIDILRQEASSVRARSYFTDRLTHETYRIQAQLQRAEHERSRRAGPVPIFGTREEVERQGPAYQSPLTSLFRQQMPSQNDVSDTAHQHSNGAAAGSHHTPASNPWLNPSVTETQRGSSGGERVEARRYHSDVAAGQSGSSPNTFQTDLRTTAMKRVIMLTFPFFQVRHQMA